VIKIGGAITEDTARKTVKALRKLKNSKDVKAVVLRVDSPGGAVTACETIYQEIQDLPQKVVVSFGNVSASGGYYISSNAERIFASPTTITGSIGVFMIRLDLRGLAKQYGITFDSVATSDMSGSFDPFYPINHRMRDNFANYTDRVYMHFKSLVGAGRNMDLDMVETVAQGRVWTGEQAKHIGLVDELGGLDRAIAYCQRNHTSGQAVVVSWPPKQSLFQFLMKRRNNNHDDDFDDLQVPSILQAFFASTPKEAIGISNFLPTDDGSVVGGGPRFPLAMSGLMLTADENWGIRCLLQDNDFPDILSQFPPGFWE
jgi:protease-4